MRYFHYVLHLQHVSDKILKNEAKQAQRSEGCLKAGALPRHGITQRSLKTSRQHLIMEARLKRKKGKRCLQQLDRPKVKRKVTSRYIWLFEYELKLKFFAERARGSPASSRCESD